ncbi:hypothetical protein GCM10009646_33250 [Streptomyces aureus]
MVVAAPRSLISAAAPSTMRSRVAAPFAVRRTVVVPLVIMDSLAATVDLLVHFTRQRPGHRAADGLVLDRARPESPGRAQP